MPSYHVYPKKSIYYMIPYISNARKYKLRCLKKPRYVCLAGGGGETDYKGARKVWWG